MIFLKSLELWVSVEISGHVASRCEFSEGGQVTPPPIPSPAPPPSPPLLPNTQHTQPVLQGCQAEIPAKKLKSGPQKKKFLAEFWLILPKTGRKGAAENIQKKFLIFSCDNCDKFDF